MTDYQVLQILKRAGITAARKEADSVRLILTMVNVQGIASEIAVTDVRTALQDQLRQLEEQRQDVQKNVFAARVEANFSLGGSSPMRMQVLKSNAQLTSEEKREKLRRLTDIETESKLHRSTLLALTHLQVHATEILPKLSPPPPAPPPKAKAPEPSTRGGKQIWVRGVKSAALSCLVEWRRIKGDEKQLLEICRQFLDRYTLRDEPDYSAEKLYNNVRQIRQLDFLE